MLDDETYHMISELPDDVLSRLGRNQPDKIRTRWQNKLLDAGVLYQRERGDRLIVTREAEFAVAEIFHKRFVKGGRIARGRPGGWKSG
jgi:hypothetical protein